MLLLKVLIRMTNNNLRKIPNDKNSPVPFFQNAVEEVAKNTQAPLDLVQLCALAAISITTQRLINVKLPGVGVVPTSLMLMIVAKSGERKSTVESKFFNPIREFEQSKQAAYENEYQNWVTKNKVWQTECKALERKLTKAIMSNESIDRIEIIKEQLTNKSLEKLKEPLQAKILYDDSTAQALYSGLQKGLSFAGLTSSEGGNVLKSGAFSDMAKLNSLWSGEPIKIDRVKSESIHIRNARLTTLIMVQPEVLADYVEKKGEQARGSGLMARFLFSSGHTTQGTRLMMPDNQEPCWEYLENFNYLIKQNLEQSYQSALQENFEPKTLELSPAAEKLWIAYYNEIERHIGTGGAYEDFGDHASKLAENAGRIAALLNHINLDEYIINEKMMSYAINISMTLSDNFKNIFNIQPKEITDSIILQSWLNDFYCKSINCNNLCRFIRKNDILQYGPKELRKVDFLNPAIQVLIDNRYVRYVKDINGTTFVDLLPDAPIVPPNPPLVYCFGQPNI